jgi:hypothetical protein
VTVICYDLEFIDHGKWQELVSIGIAAEDGGTYYAVSSQFNVFALMAEPWLRENVWPHLPQKGNGLDYNSKWVKPRRDIAKDVKEFVLGRPEPQLWSWYSAHDHVGVCSLYGGMVNLPGKFPWVTYDLEQEIRLHAPPGFELPTRMGAEHHALSDAQFHLCIARKLGIAK